MGAWPLSCWILRGFGRELRCWVARARCRRLPASTRGTSPPSRPRCLSRTAMSWAAQRCSMWASHRSGHQRAGGPRPPLIDGRRRVDLELPCDLGLHFELKRAVPLTRVRPLMPSQGTRLVRRLVQCDARDRAPDVRIYGGGSRGRVLAGRVAAPKRRSATVNLAAPHRELCRPDWRRSGSRPRRGC